MISIKENRGIVSIGDNNTNVVNLNTVNNINWNEIECELNRLLNTTKSAVLKEFAIESQNAVRKKDYNKLLSAASKIGRFGLEFLKEASYNILAEIVTKSLCQ